MIDILAISTWVCSVSLKSVPLILLVFLLQRYGKKLISAASIHLLWLLVLISLSLPLGWRLLPIAELLPFTPVSEGIVPGSTTEKASQTKARKTSVGAGPQSNAVSLPADSESATGSRLLTNLPLTFSLIWLTGIAIFFALILRQHLRFTGLKHQARFANIGLDYRLNTLRSRMKIRRDVELRVSESITSPMTFGYWKPIILLPRDTQIQLQPSQLEHILLHELTHIKRHDIAFCWLATLITIVHWFNPFAWLAANAMRENMELACDAGALEYLQKGHRANYGKTLIQLADKSHYPQHGQLAVGILENHKHLKERITMISSSHKHSPQ